MRRWDPRKDSNNNRNSNNSRRKARRMTRERIRGNATIVGKKVT